MRELQIISGGALLICDGIISQAGPSRRIENLLQAKGATEIDAKGKIVMPSFVSPDQSLVTPESSDTRLTGLSAQRLQKLAAIASAGHARVGSLVVGAHTGWAADLGTASRILRSHQAVKGKPLRIRSILSPPAMTPPEELIQKWLPVIAKRKLAPIVDINLTAESSGLQRRREVAAVASTLGFALRLRTAGAPDPLCYELASDVGALALLSGHPAAAEWLTRDAGLRSRNAGDQRIRQRRRQSSGISKKSR